MFKVCKFIFRFVIDAVVAGLVILAVMYGTKSNLTVVTTDTPNYDFNVQTPNVTDTDVVAADMVQDVEEVVEAQEIAE